MKIKLFRMLSAVLALTILILAGFPGLSVQAEALSYSGSSSYKSGRYYTQLTQVSLTGDQRTDIVNIANSQVGYQEGSDSTQLSGEVYGGENYTEYGSWYGMQDMWCAMFVSWCANQAGVSTSVVPKHAYTPSGLQWFIDEGRAYSRATVANGGYTPKPGDIIYFKSNRNSNTTNHVGIVTSYSSGTVHTIEGNTSSAAISTNGGAVCAKSYSIDDTYIVYVCSPAYKTNGSGTSESSLIPAELKSVMFNAEYYASAYSDLKEAYGNDADKLYNHFLNFGIKEGRQASPFFDVAYYLDNNADLKEAFGTDYVRAVEHYVSFGVNECRLTAAPADLGSAFYAKITGVGSGKNLSLSDDNVIIYDASTKPAQLWKFLKQSDGSYVITNEKTGKVLSVANASSSNGANVQIEIPNDGSGQRWFIYSYNGSYIFRPACASARVLDVQGGKTSAGSNVQTYMFNGTGAQKYTITKTGFLEAVGHEDIGDSFWARISLSKDTGLSLSLSGSSVVLQKNNSNAEQIWKFERQSDGGYKIINQKDGKSVLDVSGAKSSAGAKIQVYADNGSSAQRWYVYLKEGAYILHPGCAPDMILDVQDGLLKDSTPLQTNKVNSSAGQYYTIVKTTKPEEDLFSGMSAENIGTDFIGKINWPTGGLVVDVSGENVQTAAASRSSSQYWRFIRNANGTYKIVNQMTGKVLEVAGSSDRSSANIQVGADNGAPGQQWYIYKVDGKLVFSPASSTQFAMDVKGGSKSAGANIQQYAYNGTTSQMFEVTKISDYLAQVAPENLGNFYANIATDAGLYLGVSNNAVTQQSVNGSTSGQLWRFTRQSDGNYVVLNSSNGKALDITGGVVAKNTKIQVYQSNGTTAQKWLLYRVDGKIVFVSAKDNQYVLDIPSNSTKTGVQVQLYTYNATDAQMFTLKNMNDKQVTYSVTSPYNTNSIGTYTSMDQAKSVAKSKQQLGYVVYDSNGAFVYSPASSLDASRIVWEAKWVADYQKANNYNYGHAQVNPAISAGTPGCEKLTSCDRSVGWALYRAGWTDQPYKFGFTSDMCAYLRGKGFTTITNPNDLLPGDIVFVGYAGQPEPYGHVFLYAGASSNGNHYRYDAGSVDRIRCVGAYASYNSTGQPFNQPLELSSNRLFRIAYRCPANNKGYSAADSASNSNALNLTEAQKAMVFDADYYRSNNADLEAAFGTDSNKLYNHFLNFGIKEGRQGNAVFDIKYYIDSNADLKSKYGTDYVSGMKHYLSFGYNEQRVTAKPVDLGTNFYAKISISGTNLNLSLSDTNVIAYNASDKPAQVWRFVRCGDGSYNIINQKTGQALDVEGSSSSSGANVQIYNQDGTNAQKWYIYQTNGGYVLRAACSGGCVLDLANGSKTSGTNIRQYTYNGTTAQKYSINKVDYLNAVAPENLGDSFYAKITAAGNTNMNLSLCDSNVILYTNSTKPAQVWKFERQSDGSYKIVNQKDGVRVLDVAGSSSKSGTNVQIYADNGSSAQRWFIYVKEGNYILRPGCSSSTVLDITNGEMSEMTNIQTYTLNGTISQSFKIVKTDKPGEITDSEMEVLRKIIYAVESGGQVYGNATYDSFTEAYANTEKEHAITIGAGQWFANEAKGLLNLIRETDPEGFAALDTAGIAYDLDHCDWSTYQLSASSDKAKCIQRIISSPVGIQCQDYLIDEQMKQYLQEAKDLGVTDLDAQMMCANLRHLGGLSAVKRVLGKTQGGYTLDNIYAALQTDTGNQVGTFRSRNEMVYNTLKQYISE